MRLRAVLLVLALSLCACKPAAEESHMKAIVGAILIDGRGGPPLSNSIVVTGTDRIREVGAQFTVAIPEDADKVDGSGKFVVPTPLDVYRSADAKSTDRHLFQADKAVLAAARDSGGRIIGHVASQADVRTMVDGGAVGFVGMITDTEDLDTGLLGRMRDLRIFFAPALVSQGASLEIAKRNTKRLFQAGIPIAMASNGGDAGREPELLQDAGIPPLDVIVAVTYNSAFALGKQAETGTIERGKRADLLLLSANPGEDIRNLSKVALRMSGGDWVK